MRALWIFGLLLPAAAWPQSQPAWVQKSNQNAQLLIDLLSRYSPEDYGSSGMAGLDEQVSTASLDQSERRRRDLRAGRVELEKHLALEKDVLVKQDLEILISEVDREVVESEASERTLLPYDCAAGDIFFGIKTLLNEQVAANRRPAAVVRLRKYTGLEPGFEPYAEQLEKRFREKLATSGLLGPSKLEVEKDLQNTSTYVNGIGLLLEKYKLSGYQDAFVKLKEQLAAYDSFVRKEVLPRARADFRLPPEIYKIQLANYGIDYTPDELTRLAHDSFIKLQGEMQVLAAKVAKERRLPSADYRDVIAVLKKDQIPGDQIMPHYNARLAEIEGIIRRERLVTLPDRPAIIRLATAAETAQQAAPHMQPPPMLNNHGERGEFVLTLGTKGAEKALGSKFDAQRFHDFILSQGLLPPALMRKAVMERFVVSQSAN
jgi:Bacterial protein of unknown function (DUF885)